MQTKLSTNLTKLSTNQKKIKDKSVKKNLEKSKQNFHQIQKRARGGGIAYSSSWMYATLLSQVVCLVSWTSL